MKGDISWGISGNKDRIFVSTAFGCQYGCVYCYLKEMGVFGIQKTFNKKELLEELSRKEIFVPGEQGSTITIGCYAECWDEKNRETTIEMINYFLQHRNYVQISTKKKINDVDIEAIANNIQFEHQMNIFVSIPTLSHAKEFEQYTDDPILRIENLNIKRKYGINTYLYIKPVIRGITIRDKNKYAEIIKKYQVPAVVGEMLHPTIGGTEKGLLIGKMYMKEQHCDESDKLADFLGQYTRIYRHSDDIIKQMKK